MSNVLPPSEKKRLSRRIHMRFVFVGSLLLLLGALVSSAALVPAFISVRFAEESLRTNEAAATAAAKDDVAIQARTQALLDTLRPIINATTTPSAAVSAAILLKPKQMSIMSVSYRRGLIVLSGQSEDRQLVTEYRDALQKEGRFTSVVIPVAALVGAQEGRFTVTLGGTF